MKNRGWRVSRDRAQRKVSAVQFSLSLSLKKKAKIDSITNIC